MRRTAVVLCALALGVSALAGCGRDQPSEPTRTIEPVETASSPSPDATPEKSIACDLLTEKERRSVAGKDLEVLAPISPLEGSDQCRWVDTLKSAAPATIQVTVAPAEVWAAREVPALVDFALRGGVVNDKVTKKLIAMNKELKRDDDDLGGGRACEMFSLLGKAMGRKTEEFVSMAPVGNQLSAQAQLCRKGIHASVSYGEANLTPSPVLGQAVLRLVKAVHARAVKKGYGD